MSVILLPRRHYTQPTGRLVVSDEQTSSLRFLAAGSRPRNVLTGSAFTVFGDAPYRPTEIASPVGDALSFNADGSGAGGFAEDASVTYIPPPFSVLMLVKKSALFTETLIAFGGSSQGRGWKLSSVANSRLLRITYGAVADYNISSAFFPAAPEYMPFVVTVQGSQCVAYRPSLRAAVSVGSPLAPTKPLTLGAAHNNTAYTEFSGSEIALSALWSRALSENEALDLLANPWQLFRADPVRIYSLPSGPIIPSLSALTTTNITQSGARHSLTLTF